jgi:hypothetical protein
VSEGRGDSAGKTAMTGPPPGCSRMCGRQIARGSYSMPDDGPNAHFQPGLDRGELGVVVANMITHQTGRLELWFPRRTCLT